MEFCYNLIEGRSWDKEAVRMNANDTVGGLVTPVVADMYLQPLFLDWDRTAVDEAKTGDIIRPRPEFRAIPADYTQAVRAQLTPPSTQAATGAIGTIERGIGRKLIITVVADQTDGSSATGKDVRMRIIKWLPVKLNKSSVGGKPDMYVPVVHAVYRWVFGDTAAGSFATDPLSLLGGITPTPAAVDFAHTVTAIVAPAGDGDIFSPANNMVAWVLEDVYGAPLITIDIGGATAGAVAPPEQVQVFYGWTN